VYFVQLRFVYDYADKSCQCLCAFSLRRFTDMSLLQVNSFAGGGARITL
jgi:hypothetical protein